MAHKVEIKIVDTVIEGDYIQMRTYDPNYKITFKSQRTGFGEATIGANANETAQNLYNALQIDYGVWSSQILYNGANVVTLYNTGYDNYFDLRYTPGPQIIIDSSIVGSTGFTYFSEFSEADTNPCDNIKVKLDFSDRFYKLEYGENQNQLTTKIINDSTVTFDIPRNTSYYKFTLINGQVKIRQALPIRGFTPTHSVNYTPGGGVTLTLFENYNVPDFNPYAYPDAGFEYSIDGVNYYSFNRFSGLEAGEYTAYIRDSFGCEKQLIVEISEFETTREPYNEVSILNSIKFARRDEKPKTFKNTLSYEEGENNYKDFQQKFLNDEVPVTQFRSNYIHNRAYLLKDGEQIFELQVFKRSNNLDKTDVRDAEITPLGDNEYSVYFFQGGNIYDGNDIIGQTEIDGFLLSHHQAGNLIQMGGFGWVQIKKVTSNNEIIVSLPSPPPFILKISTFWDEENYEVYEFQTDFNGLSGGCFQVGIETVNTILTLPGGGVQNYTRLDFLSEPIEVVPELEKHHKLEWKNSENNQITWATGINSFGYLPYQISPTFAPESDSDVYMTDTTKRALEYNLDETYTFHFEALPMGMARQLAYIVSCDMLQIDGIFYVREEEPSIEPLIGSNLYNVQIVLTLSNKFNSNQKKGTTDIDSNVSGYLGVGSSAGYLKI